MHPHPHLIIDSKQAEERSLRRNRITAIIPTQNAPLRFFMWSVLSFLLNSNFDWLEHIIVVINGPDCRTGSTTLQDKKQSFIEDLRSIGRGGQPITLNRIWSRVGHTQSVEGVIPWVHTEYYLMAHDDVIVIDENWTDQIGSSGFLKDPRRSLMNYPPRILASMRPTSFEGKNNKIGIPHINTSFLLVRKSAVHDVGERWWGYHHKIDLDLTEPWGEEFVRFHASRGHIQQGAELRKKYEHWNADVGAFVYYALDNHGYNFYEFKPSTIHHFGAASWDSKNLPTRELRGTNFIKQLEEKIHNSEFSKLYQKYMD